MLALPAVHHAPRRGFTLVELLVAMTIISILSSLVLVAMFGAQEQARVNRTEAQIAKIHELIMTKYEEYESRPVQVEPSTPYPPNIQRLCALRELMRRELPDRMTDVVSDTSTYTISPRYALRASPALQLAYVRRVLAVQNAGGGWTREHEGSECLYMIISLMRDGDRKAIEFFSADEIGDLDGDGMPEILDAWGQPIDFLRWAPGFCGPSLSTLQPGTLVSVGGGQFLTGDMDPDNDGSTGGADDSFDLVRADPRWNDFDPNSPRPERLRNDPFMLFPLVYSRGPDNDGNIGRDQEPNPVDYSHTHVAARTSDYYVEGAPSPLLPNDPYIHLAVGSPGVPRFIGTPLPGNGHIDNIHNHLIIVRGVNEVRDE